MEISYIQDVEDIAGKRVLVRGSLNAPVENGTVTDAYRLEKLLPTLELLHKKGAKVLMIGHLSGGADATLKPAYVWLNERLPMTFVNTVFDVDLDAVDDGSIVLAENIRQYPEEKNNDAVFAKRLAALADMYVNDDFTVSHREHASVVGVPQHVPSYAGLQFQAEVEHLREALNAPSPSILIIGGAKFESKVPLALQFVDHVDHVVVGGAIMNLFLAAQGYPVGASLLPKEDIDVSDVLGREQLVVPSDVLVKTASGEAVVRKIDTIEPGDVVVDVGPDATAQIVSLVREAAFVLWGGPLGHYESGFNQATHDVAEAIAEGNALSIIGGGDVDAAIEKLGLRDQFTFVSTAGGALMDFLLDGSTPGVEALQK